MAITAGLHTPVHAVKKESQEKTQQKSYFSSFSPFNWFPNVTKWAKRGAYTALGFLGYKMVAKPISSFILGKKITNTVDTAVNLSLVVAGITGVIYLFNENKNRIMDGIKNLGLQIKSMKNYITKRFNRADLKIDALDKKMQNMQGSLSEIKTTTTETNHMVREIRGKK